jgi:hypothetical protein
MAIVGVLEHVGRHQGRRSLSEGVQIPRDRQLGISLVLSVVNYKFGRLFRGALCRRSGRLGLAGDTTPANDANWRTRQHGASLCAASRESSPRCGGAGYLAMGTHNPARASHHKPSIRRHPRARAKVTSTRPALAPGDLQLSVLLRGSGHKRGWGRCSHGDAWGILQSRRPACHTRCSAHRYTQL